MSQFPDYDGDAVQLVRACFDAAKEFQAPFMNQQRRDFLTFHAYAETIGRDPSMAHITVPKVFSITRSKVARDASVMLKTRPYIPFEANKRELRVVSKFQNRLADLYLHEANYPTKFVLLDTLKTLYGTAFMEALPYYRPVEKEIQVPVQAYGLTLGMQPQKVMIRELAFKLRVFADWEIMADPFAESLEDYDGCRWVIKMQIASRREILRMAQMGAYPNADLTKLMDTKFHQSVESQELHGNSIMRAYGIGSPKDDQDVCVIMRYESRDRYIDLLNGWFLLREGPNPFAHRSINLARAIHSMEAHPQLQFRGIGEAKPNEILQALLGDTWSITVNTSSYLNQPMIYYRKEAVNPDQLVRTKGNRVEIDQVPDNRPITDAFFESPGQPLPADHYMLPTQIERMMDLTSNVWNVQRGESDGTDKTLGEAAMLKDAGDSVQELNIKLMEQVFAKRFNDLFLCHMKQYVTPYEIRDKLGEEALMYMQSAHPGELPGGYDYSMKGSERVLSLLVRQRNLKELAEPVLTLLQAGQIAYAKQLLEAHEFAEEEIDEIVNDAMLMMQMQQEQAAQEAEQQQMQSDQSAKHEDAQGDKNRKHEEKITRLKVNGTARESQQSGKEGRPKR